MVRTCCLAGIASDDVAVLTGALRAADAPALAVVAPLRAVEIARVRPDLCICDLDFAESDALEFLRQLRFVLPVSLLAVYTSRLERTWAVSCHLAGANALLLKGSSEDRLGHGLSGMIQSGCYTDPRFAAA
jgi:DNA-binding NarL/FixJ family response regulator